MLGDPRRCLSLTNYLAHKAADKLFEQRAVDRVSTLKKAKPVSLAEL